MKVLGINNKISFGRRPTKEEEPKIQRACEKAYEVMGTKDRIVITHGSCFPVFDRDTHIGSPYGNAAKQYIKFLQLYGFNGNQLGPSGELEMKKGKVKTSPYNSSAFAKNRLFIDLKDLTTDKYGNILSQETYNNVTSIPETTNKEYSMTDFQEAVKTYDEALSESYKNFQAKLIKGHKNIIQLNNEFQNFLQRQDQRLTDEGIFKVLAKYYETDNFDNWDNELDKNLISEIHKQNPEAINRYNRIKQYNKTSINQYKFEQFIATKQIKENKEWRDASNFKYINDLLIGCAKMDEWRYKDAFLDNYSIGAFEYSGKHQIWGIPALDPRKIFIGPEMELNIGGQFLKEKLNFNLEFCENTRIDHALGLIEPFLIRKDSISFDKDGNIDYNKIKGSFMSETYENGKRIDDYYNYPRLIEKIIIPTLKEHNLKPEDSIWETVCSNPKMFKEIFYNKLKLPELTQLEWSRLENANQNNWTIVGSHDSIPAQSMIKQEYIRKSLAWDPLYLAGYLNQDPARLDGNKHFCEEISDKYSNGTPKAGEALIQADIARVNAKFAELLTAKKFEISFADLLGITDMVYNIGGVNSKNNWKERIPSDYIDKYYKNLSSEHPTALNMPEILKIALQAEIDQAVVKSDDKDSTRQKLHEKYQPLLDELQQYADILKEPEEDNNIDED